MLQGTLDLLVLRTVAVGPAHGHTIAYAIERDSNDVLQVERGSLYPALRARYYRLTPARRRQLAAPTSRSQELVRAIDRVLRPA
jgi:PadR family transcriptional regulator, regulatory protein PadR